MPNANKIVPIPTTPPIYHPTNTALISTIALISASDKCVVFCKPVINPSLGPGPRLAIK